MPIPNLESFCDKLNMQNSEPVLFHMTCADGCAILHAQHNMEGSEHLLLSLSANDVCLNLSKDHPSASLCADEENVVHFKMGFGMDEPMRSMLSADELFKTCIRDLKDQLSIYTKAAATSHDEQESSFESMLYADPDLPDEPVNLDDPPEAPVHRFGIPRRKGGINREIYF